MFSCYHKTSPEADSQHKEYQMFYTLTLRYLVISAETLWCNAFYIFIFELVYKT